MKHFSIDETHGIPLRPGSDIRVSSDHLGWRRLYASVQREQPYEGCYAAVPDHLIFMHLDGPVAVNRTIAGQHSRQVIPPRGLFVLPGHVDFNVRLEDELTSLHIYLRHSLVAEIARDIFKDEPDNVEIVPQLLGEDPLMEQLALEIRRLLDERDTPNSVYAEYLAMALGARLVRHHSTHAHDVAQIQPVAGGLSSAQMARAIDFMDAYLDRTISLRKIAASTDLTVTHFARRFKTTTGLPPHQFLIRRRFERAKWLLAQSDLCLAEVALSAGFSHQEHLARIFRRFCNTTPAAYRRSIRS